MKKQYNTPEIEILQIPKLEIVTISEGSGDGGNRGEGSSRGQADWDDDDE